MFSFKTKDELKSKFRYWDEMYFDKNDLNRDALKSIDFLYLGRVLRRDKTESGFFVVGLYSNKYEELERAKNRILGFMDACVFASESQ